MSQQTDRVEAIFYAALEKASSEERTAYLQEACAGNVELRQRVDTLLADHARAGSFLDRPAVEWVSPEATSASLGSSSGLAEPTQALKTTDGEPASQHPSAATQADTRLDDKHREALAFLERSTKPGSLGRLDHYEIQEIIGKGGFGTVFKAFDEKLHRVVAIKLLAPELAVSGTAKARFLREARAAAAVRHEHVVDIHAVDDDPVPYLVMEYVEGQTLQEKLDKSGPLEVKEILRIGYQTACGLAAAHKQGLIHRDIKPGNILLENGVERVKLTDFGLARAMDDASVTQSGVVAGTPMYMSPEQAEGLTLDHRSDLFSLGTVLYVTCTGRPPFRASGTMAILKRVCEDSPRPIREINSEIPQWLCHIVEKLHAKKPEERFTSAKEVADVLAKYLAEIQTHGQVLRVAGAEALRSPGEAAKHIVAAPQLEPVTRWWTYAGALLLIATAVFTLVVTLVPEVRQPMLGSVVLSPKLGVSLAAMLAALGIGLWTGRRQIARSSWSQLGKGALPVLGLLCFLPVFLFIWISQLMHKTPDGPTPGPPVQSAADKDGWVQLFNGKDLTGWHIQPGYPGEWEVKDGVLIGKQPKKGLTRLISKRGDWGDFHLRAQVKINAAGNSGIWFRAPADGVDGYEAQINSTHKDTKTGSLLLKRGAQFQSLHSVEKTPIPPNTWFWLEVIAVGKALTIRVDDKTLAEVEDASHARGHLVLESFENWSIASFTKIEIKELPPRDTPPFAVAPFDAAEAKEHQDAWAKHLGVPVEITNSIGMKLRLIPPGEFMMGSSPEQIARFAEIADDWAVPAIRGEGPQRKKQIAEPFFLGIHEVTCEQFRAFVKASGHKPEDEANGKGGRVWNKKERKFETRPAYIWSNRVFTPTDLHPVGFVTRKDAEAFCAWLSKEDGRRYVLPTPEQWEFACRAGSTSAWSFGDDDKLSDEFAWFNNNSSYKTHPVGCKKANSFGLFDMHGNVEELISPGPFDAIARGGTGMLPDWAGRSTSGGVVASSPSYWGRGFRVALVGNPKPQSPQLAVAPFDAAEAKEHQEAWAKHLGVPVEITNSIGMKLRLIPPSNNPLESSRHGGSAEPFFVGAHEVTVGQFRQFVEESKYQTAAETNKLGGIRVYPGKKGQRDSKHIWSHPEIAPTADHPVSLVTWQDARAFCDWLSRKDGRTYRLPTDAEWRWAAHAGSDNRFYFGDNVTDLAAHAWHWSNATGAQPVGVKQANPWDLFDMYGNVWELTHDWQRDGKLMTPTAPGEGPVGTDRLNFLGGSFNDPPESTIEPGHGPPLVAHSHVGFRVALVGDLKAKTPPAEPWVQLWNGKDLDHWADRHSKNSAWNIQGGGILQAKGQRSTLATKRNDFDDFHLRMELMTNATTAATLNIRTDGVNEFPTKVVKGIEVNLKNEPGKSFLGQLHYRGTHWQDAKPDLVKPDTWFTLEVIAQGKRIMVKLNDQVAVDHIDEKWTTKSGVIALHQLEKCGLLKIRKIEIKKLSFGTISGLVTEDGRPKGAVKVELRDAKGIRVVEIMSSVDGTYRFERVRPGEYELSCGPYKVNVSVIADQDTLMRFDLAAATGTPFAILSKDAKAERTFATFADAVKASKSGDTIEIRGDGPFVTPPIFLKDKPLAIRAGRGYRPILRLSPQAVQAIAPLLDTDAALILEGLELQRLGTVPSQPGKHPRGIHVGRAPLAVINCRIVVTDGYGIETESPRCEVRNTEFVGESRLSWSTGGELLMENCLRYGGNTGLVLWHNWKDNRTATARLRHNTLVANNSPVLLYVSQPRQTDLKAQAIRVDASHNIFEGNQAAFHARCMFSPPSLEEFASSLPNHFDLVDRANLYSNRAPLLQCSHDDKSLAPLAKPDLGAWRMFWGTPDLGSLRAAVRFQQDDVLTRALKMPEILGPAEFRLHTDSAGKGKDDGKDLGADVDLVGPGAAYEKWQKTKEYEEWRKQTDALMAVAAEPFVILAKDAKAEQRFATLADAVKAAQSGDTIEIRGDGPYDTEPVNLGKRALIIRAGSGSHPVLRCTPKAAPAPQTMIITSAPLVAEGIEFRYEGDASLKNAVISANQQPVFVANCRFQGLGDSHALIAPGCPIVDVRNCYLDFPKSGSHVISWTPQADAQHCAVENCVGNSRRNLLNVNYFDFKDGSPPDHIVRLTRNTWLSQQPLRLRFYQLPAEDRAAGLRVEIASNLLDCEHALTLESRDEQKPFATPDSEKLRKKFIHWQEKDNLYPPDISFLLITRVFEVASKSKIVGPDPPVKSLTMWHMLWGLADTGSVQATPRFRGGNVSEILRAEPFKLQPVDFRLADGSPGKGGGKDAKDLGADVDFVGPGPAYEKWKKTPEYQEWLKRTGQAIAKATPTEPALQTRFDGKDGKLQEWVDHHSKNGAMRFDVRASPSR